MTDAPVPLDKQIDIIKALLGREGGEGDYTLSILRGVLATLRQLARLREPDVREAIAEAAWNGWVYYRDVNEARWSQLTKRQQGAWLLAMDAGLAVITQGPREE